MLGLVICGGQSTRMGRDKGLLLQQTNTWAQLAADKLQALHILVKLSVNREQLASYSIYLRKVC